MWVSAILKHAQAVLTVLARVEVVILDVSFVQKSFE